MVDDVPLAILIEAVEHVLAIAMLIFTDPRRTVGSFQIRLPLFQGDLDPLPRMSSASLRIIADVSESGLNSWARSSERAAASYLPLSARTLAR